MTTATEYYNQLKGALGQIDSAIVTIQNQMTDEFDSINYAQMLMDANNSRRSILKMLAINKFMRLSQDTFIEKIENPSSQKIIITYTVKQFDTPIGIALKFNMALQDLLQKNNIVTSDFVPGLVLNIEVDDSNGMGEFSKIYDDIPTFGSQEGLLVLGQDAGNDLKCVNGDLNILAPEDTVAQGVLNRLTTDPAQYPYEKEFGVTNLAGTELPFDLIQGMYTLEVNDQLNLDKRIQSINSLVISRSGDGVIINGSFLALNNVPVNVSTQ